MTFTELVTEVLARTRQTSTEAQTRIGREVNDRNRRITSSIGLQTARRGEVSTPTVAADPSVVFAVEKIIDVYLDATGSRRVLGERTFDSWRSINTNVPASGIPQTYAISRMNPGTVEIVLDPVPDGVYTLRCDGLIPSTTLSGTDEPPFAVDFHDVVMHGALADEWTQLKQGDLARAAESLYQERLSELRMFIAKSAYLSIFQGGQPGGWMQGPYWPAYRLPQWWR